MARFDGKVALFSGAASGIGRASAVQLAGEGAAVFGIDINEVGLAETGALVEAAGGRWAAQVADVAKKADCVAAVQSCVDAFGRIDVLGNIAGLIRADRIEDVTEEELDLQIGVNIKGLYLLTQAALAQLRASKGSIVNIGSNAGLMGQAYTSVYCATKGAVINVTRSFAIELIKDGVRANVVAPGGVATPLSTNFRMPRDPDFELMGRYTAVGGVMCEPEEIARVVAFVASDDAPNMTGAVVSVDHGLTAG